MTVKHAMSPDAVVADSCSRFVQRDWAVPQLVVIPVSETLNGGGPFFDGITSFTSG